VTIVVRADGSRAGVHVGQLKTLHDIQALARQAQRYGISPCSHAPFPNAWQRRQRRAANAG